MFKYDIPYAKEGQLTLTVNDMPINFSKNISYLKEKLRAHRDMMVKERLVKTSATYKIVDTDGKIIYEKTFREDEKGDARTPYWKEKKETINYVKRGQFSLIADNDGNILTDEELLSYLYDFRFYNVIPVIVTNQALVSMATYKPQTREEFISLKGLGERTYEKCGEIFINAIRDFLGNKKTGV